MNPRPLLIAAACFSAAAIALLFIEPRWSTPTMMASAFTYGIAAIMGLRGGE